MRKFLMTMAAVSALSVGVPAAAQNAGVNVRARIQQLETRLDAGIRSRAITRREAMPLRSQLLQLTQLERQYAVGGFNGRETADLQQRIQGLRRDLGVAEGDVANRYDRNRDGNDDRYDRNGDGDDDRYDRNNDGNDDRYDRNGDNRDDRYDTNRDGYDDRDRNCDGRWDDDLGSRYEYEGNRGGVLGQVINSLTGGGTLQVGQRASADLGALPYAYRDRYRDGNGAYYRTDGRAIYQIDLRTNAVVRVYPMDR